MQWRNVDYVLALPIARDWAKAFAARVAAATGKQIQTEASRATLEAIGRKLRTRGWKRFHTSKSRVDRRADSRYYRSPANPLFVIRLSNHAYPGGCYTGAKDYMIDARLMDSCNVLGVLRMIEADEKGFNIHVHRQEKAMRRASAKLSA